MLLKFELTSGERLKPIVIPVSSSFLESTAETTFYKRLRMAEYLLTGQIENHNIHQLQHIIGLMEVEHLPHFNIGSIDKR